MSDTIVEETTTPGHEPPSLFKDAMRMVGEQIPPRALAWLWTIHVTHSDSFCPAHQHGEICCVDVLLDSVMPGLPLSTDEHKLADFLRVVFGLADIIRAGYDLEIESEGDDREGAVEVYLTYENQVYMHELKYVAPSPDLIGRAISAARDYAVACPKRTVEA